MALSFLRFSVLPAFPLTISLAALLFEMDKQVQLNMTTQVVEPFFIFLLCKIHRHISIEKLNLFQTNSLIKMKSFILAKRGKIG